MPLVIDAYLGPCLSPVTTRESSYAYLSIEGRIRPRLPSGALRIGGDSPDGLVLVGGAPAARTVDLFDRATRTWVATTTSAGAGTYAFAGLSARTDGYDVVIRGVIASGELDVIIPGVQPG